ncbi:SDR family NAD(P)-dependent oxidoreductase [[Limnothrix rosea] IAM M-220]|uniref:SDR family NAD(P)-dependent oxidoreductase n=1 Tax=[Limnothrix rosea] IAM M-220 TaxID=454133 RepID=UPI0009597FBE|nr:SDR family NAD(P)-dependent oxidoreductase [[Limnothrix rosea] IAM M-220]OKH11063.1 short-chain dehydrogenase [[Limnothrix rosea] IAM M-220]
MKRIAIIGATSAIAENCARLWVQVEPANLVLVGRSEERLARVANDLKVRSPESEIQILESDFLDAAAVKSTVESLWSAAPVDIVLIAHGYLPTQSDCQENLAECRNALEINAISPVLFAEAFADQMEKVNQGAIAIIGSVAGDRGRKSNYVYGSAKGLVDRYAQGLQHRFAGTNLRVTLVKPGPTDTPMTAHLKAEGAKLASVETVAAQIVNAIAKGSPVVYSPTKWQLIMAIIRNLPAPIFNKLNI